MAKSKNKNKKKKVELVFDPQKRREFLTGFRKRKQERRQKAKAELEQQVKEERKRIKQEIKEGFQNQFKRSLAPIVLEGKLKEEEYDAEDVTVQIVELSTDELAKINHWIGPNKPVYSQNGHSDDANQATDEDDDNNIAGDDDDDDEGEAVPGFTVTNIKERRKGIKREKNEGPAECDEDNDEDTKKKIKKIRNLKTEFKTKRGMGQFMAKKTQNTLKHSKAFRTKAHLDRVKSKKKSRIERQKKEKLLKKKGKFNKDTSKPQKNKKFGRK